MGSSVDDIAKGRIIELEVVSLKLPEVKSKEMEERKGSKETNRASKGRMNGTNSKEKAHV